MSGGKDTLLNNLLVGGVIVGLVVAVLLLAFENRELKKRLTPPDTIVLKPGESVGPTRIVGLDGQEIEITFDDPSMSWLVFVLSTTCPHCERNLPAWASIVEKAPSSGLSIIGVSIHNVEVTKRYFADKRVKFILYSAADTSFDRMFKILSVPQTILLKPGGIVEKVWVGELGESTSHEIAKLLSRIMQ
jgi:peroxiredoxin